MTNNAIKNFSSVHIGCHHCDLFQLCKTAKTTNQTMEDSHLNISCYKYERGEYLYRENNPFKSVYAIHSGSIKTFMSAGNGKEQVTGFHLQGKLLGLTEMNTSCYMESAVALETCSICKIPFKQIEQLSKENINNQRILFNVLSKEIQYDRHHLNLIAREPAESRLAGFLLDISNRFGHLGFSATEFNLSMTRSDIASLLGLAVETVSRLFSQFQEKGLLTVEQRHIKLYDVESLMKMSPEYYKRAITEHFVQNKVS